MQVQSFLACPSTLSLKILWAGAFKQVQNLGRVQRKCVRAIAHMAEIHCRKGITIPVHLHVYVWPEQYLYLLLDKSG